MRRQRKDNEANDKKNLILDAAKARFDRFGFKKTTVDEISKDAGISKRTLYEHFKDKEDLFVSLFIREALKARKAVLARLEDAPDPVEKLKRFLHVARDYFREEPFMTRVLRDEDGLYAPFLKQKYNVLVEQQGILDIISDLLEEGIKRGKVRKLDTRLTSYIIFKLFQAFTYARTIPLPSSPKGEEKELDEMVDFLLAAVVRKDARRT